MNELQRTCQLRIGFTDQQMHDLVELLETKHDRDTCDYLYQTLDRPTAIIHHKYSNGDPIYG